MVQIALQSEPQGDRPEPSAQPRERLRLQEERAGLAAWKHWGPYLSASASGARCARTTARTATPGTTSRTIRRASRAYRWGEDGIAGICDEQQRLCLALALWNGRDPILKERLFGLTNGEGNHGEDVKELYYYLDATPTHSLPEAPLQVSAGASFPTPGWSRRTAGAARTEPEFELLDTGVFDDDRYFDVFVEYAKAAPEDILMQVTVAQSRTRAGDAAPAAAALVPQHLVLARERRSALDLYAVDGATIGVRSKRLRRLPLCTATARRSCCSPTTRPTSRRLFGRRRAEGYFKDGFHEYVVHGNGGRGEPGASPAPRPARTTASRFRRPAARQIRLRLTTRGHESPPFADFDEIAGAAPGRGR